MRRAAAAAGQQVDDKHLGPVWKQLQGRTTRDELRREIERLLKRAEEAGGDRRALLDEIERTVREMKEKGSRGMRTIGSLTLCRSLLNAGLVDRFRVVVFPVITGSTGRERIYDGYPDVALDMISSRTFDGRIQLLEYVPTILDGPPGTNPVKD